MQVGPHSYFFSYSYPRRNTPTAEKPESRGKTRAAGAFHRRHPVRRGADRILAEFMSGFLTEGLKGTGAPVAIMAILVAANSQPPRKS